MLVISQNIVLSAAEAALPAGTPLILWDSIVTASNIASSSVEAGYPASNLANPSTNQEWRAEETSPPGAVELTVTTNTSDLLAGVGIARHNFGTAGIAVEVGYYDENSPEGWISLAGPQIPANDEPLLLRFTAQSLAFVVIKLAAGTAAARAAVCYVGPLLVMERGYDIGKDFTPPRFARKTEAVNGRSARGDFLGRIVTSQWLEGIALSFSHLRPDWYREHLDPFVAAAQRDVPFFFAWQPVAYSTEVAYCWFADDPVPQTNPVTGRKRLTLNLGGIVE